MELHHLSPTNYISDYYTSVNLVVPCPSVDSFANTNLYFVCKSIEQQTEYLSSLHLFLFDSGVQFTYYFAGFAVFFWLLLKFALFILSRYDKLV